MSVLSPGIKFNASLKIALPLIVIFLMAHGNLSIFQIQWYFDCEYPKTTWLHIEQFNVFIQEGPKGF